MNEVERRERILFESMSKEQLIDSHIISQLNGGNWAKSVGRAECDRDRAVIDANHNYSRCKIAESLISDKSLDITKSVFVDVAPVILFLCNEKDRAVDEADYERASQYLPLIQLLEDGLKRLAAVENRLNTIDKKED